jgi:hypothetical protein
MEVLIDCCRLWVRTAKAWNIGRDRTDAAFAASTSPCGRSCGPAVGGSLRPDVARAFPLDPGLIRLIY